MSSMDAEEQTGQPQFAEPPQESHTSLQSPAPAGIPGAPEPDGPAPEEPVPTASHHPGSGAGSSRAR